MTVRAIDGCGYRMYEDQREFEGGGWLWLDEMLAGAADEVPLEEPDDPDPLRRAVKGLVVEGLEREEIKNGFFLNRLEAIATVQQEIWYEQDIESHYWKSVTLPKALEVQAICTFSERLIPLVEHCTDFGEPLSTLDYIRPYRLYQETYREVQRKTGI